MTVIAWDGKTLAADKQAQIDRLAFRVTKIRKVSGNLVGISGDFAPAQELFKWLDGGARPEDCPAFQKNKDDWCPILLITPARRILRYEFSPHPFEVEESFFAVGSGSEMAIAAMALGKTAVEAVELVSERLTCCGLGVDALTLDDA